MYKKIFLTLFSVFVLSVSFFAGWITSYTYTHPKTTSISTISNLDPYKIYNLVNDYRASKGVNKLLLDPSLCAFTQERLNEIHTDYTHQGFYENGKKVLGDKYLGENLNKITFNEQETVSSWITSPEHEKNMLNQTYTRTCIATDTQGNIHYVVQEFASF